MTTAAGIAAAYATEIDSCDFRADAGPRKRSRPQEFCDSVSIASTLDVASTATFAVPIDVTTAVIVNGVSYMPSTLTGLGASAQVLTAGGVPIVLTAPTPPAPGPPSETFTDITVTNLANFKNISITGTATGVFDAGAY